MDENFEGFLEDFGPAIHRHDVPESSIDRYRGKLPDQLLAYWQEHGWCGYADGLFWTVDPQEYESVLDAWIGETQFMERDAYHVIARSAFGTLYFWGERTGFALKLFSPGAYVLPRSLRNTSLNKQIQDFFCFRDRSENDFDELFAPALKKLGYLQYDQMYGFVPALALGGAATLANLQIVGAVEHLVLLAGLSELRVMNTPTI
jgi:hypothetical protein